MNKIYIMLILFLLCTSCATKSLPSSFSILTEEGISKNISLKELDSSARKYIADNWEKPLNDIKQWKLINAKYRNENTGIELTYKRKMAAPYAIVTFNKHGLPNKIMGYK